MRVERQLILYSIPFLLLLIWASLAPLLYILAKSIDGGLQLWESMFTGAPSVALPGWNVGLSQTLLWLPMARSIFVGMAATLLSVFLGTAFAVLVATSNMRYKRAFVYSQVLQFVIPPLTIAQFWIVISELFRFPPFLAEGPLPMVLVLGVHFQSLVFLIENASLRRLDQTVLDAARISGARYSVIVRRVILPLAVPGIVTSFALSLFFNLSAFTPLFVLGTGSSPYYTLSMQIYSGVSWVRYSTPVSTQIMLTLALVLTFVALVPFLVYLNSTRRWSVRTVDWNKESQMFSLGSATWPLSVMVLLFGVLSVTSPVAFLFLQSFNFPTLGGLPSQLSFSAVQQVLSSGAVAASVLSTITLGLTASIACVAMSFAMSYLSIRMKGKPIGFTLYLLATVPFLIPAAALGTAYLTIVTSTASSAVALWHSLPRHTGEHRDPLRARAPDRYRRYQSGEPDAGNSRLRVWSLRLADFQDGGPTPHKKLPPRRLDSDFRVCCEGGRHHNLPLSSAISGLDAHTELISSFAPPDVLGFLIPQCE